jgi:hypothetical protein
MLGKEREVEEKKGERGKRRIWERLYARETIDRKNAGKGERRSEGKKNGERGVRKNWERNRRERE